MELPYRVPSSRCDFEKVTGSLGRIISWLIRIRSLDFEIEPIARQLKLVRKPD